VDEAVEVETVVMAVATVVIGAITAIAAGKIIGNTTKNTPTPMEPGCFSWYYL
jgi:hypothetical protein